MIKKIDLKILINTKVGLKDLGIINVNLVCV
jgi:hypothetical protein